ncbi:MAG TPA: PilZ domain-containing protein [Candidatus Acidoferrales bacterium]|nr:PilZ domain-containing protein [Candidatus Acidoferrales bacterium]
MDYKLGIQKESEKMRLDPAERRRSPRIHLQIPIFMRGVDSTGAEFLELSKTLDISASGAFLACTRALRLDQSVNLTIPAPSPVGSSSMPPETPPITARVKRHRTSGDVHFIAVEFPKSLE